MSKRDFFVESHISSKELNNQSVSLVIPRLTRDKIHNVLYYKVNLTSTSLRGNTMLQLSKIIIRDLGQLKDSNSLKNYLVGGVEFKCLLMKLIEIRPTFDQITMLLEKKKSPDDTFENKYIVALILTYLRIQYYYLKLHDASHLINLFREYINDYRKLKGIDMDMDCWSMSQQLKVEIIHIDELVDRLATNNNIWGIPLGKCQWSNIFELDDESDSGSDSSSGDSDSD
ncbi:hypothetical protein NCAS_0C00360 [Naumovozyma castellii]|uniref:Pre-mRNA-splicing factor 38 n=1 Tax=Naumovozyma castellii TaxID=27288 RepID=G0VC19_NAUCA|nr:hypothetical protein NCAS_0C00360 [Naumovozyma castellii CBS 4309]CCC69026.1 hypothetical protein NCAS_0C00360 [Naumovozyma castellii CBS 4309]